MPAGVLDQGLVSRAGRAGGSTGGLAVTAATGKTVAVPFTTADRETEASPSKLMLDATTHLLLLDMHNITV